MTRHLSLVHSDPTAEPATPAKRPAPLRPVPLQEAWLSVPPTETYRKAREALDARVAGRRQRTEPCDDLGGGAA